MERRSAQLVTKDNLTLHGTAVVFNQQTTIATQNSNYNEIILPSAFNNTDLTDVQLYLNHNATGVPLARTPNTLKINITNTGVDFTALLPNTQEGRSVYEAVKRGDLKGCSFGFIVDHDKYNKATNTRVITGVKKLIECSIVTHPAYKGTNVEARSKTQKQKEIKNMKFKTIEDAFNYYIEAPKSELEERLIKIAEELEATKDKEEKELLKIEEAGIKEVLNNNDEKRSNTMHNKYNPITSRSFKHEERSNNVFNSVEYRNAFFKFLKGEEATAEERSAWKRAQAETRAIGTVASEGAVIPTQTLNEVISKARKTGGVLGACRNFNIPANLSVPVGTPTATAQWHVEGEEVEGEKANTVAVKFGANEILKVFSISTAVKNMSIDAFENYLIEELYKSVFGCLENAVINGTGVGQGAGLSTIDFKDNAVKADKTIKYTDVVNTVAKLKKGYASNAQWAMSNATLYKVFYGMCDTTGRPIFLADLQNEAVGKILGFNVIIDDNISDDTVYFGDFNYLGYNLPNGVTVEASKESNFRSALIDYRAIAVADCKPIVDEAFVQLKIK